MKLYHELAKYYYYIENNHRNIQNDISLIKKLMGRRESPSVLDIGCGTGEHLALLSRQGYNCTGIDNSEEMLKYARKRAARNEVFIKRDMLEFDFYEDFDLVMSLFGTLNYAIEDTDVDRVLWNIWRALKPDGAGLLEVWNSIPVIRIKEKPVTHVSSTRVDGSTIERERGFRLIENPGKTIVEVSYRYTLKNDDTEKILNDRHVMRSFKKEEINRFLLGNGFKVQGYYSNFRLFEYDESSNRIIIIFRKE